MRICPAFSEGRYNFFYIAFVVFAIVLTQPCAARAAELWVNCSDISAEYHTIQDAVNALPPLPPGGQNSITIVSDCTENVTISGQHRLLLKGWPCSIWCGDPPVKITGAHVDANGNPDRPVLSISGSQEVSIENLILTHGSIGLSVGGGSSVNGYVIKAEGNSNMGIQLSGPSSLVLYEGDAIGNDIYGIQVNPGSVLDLNGNTPWVPNPQPFVVSGNGGAGTNPSFGGIYTSGTLNIGGGVTIQNNSPCGIFASGGGQNLIGDWHGPNLIQKNVVGVRCWESAQCITYGTNTIRNNATVGVEISYGGVGVFTGATTIEGNSVGGVLVTAGSHARFNEQSKIRKNGSTREPMRAGIRVDGTSQVLLDSSDNEVAGNIGPGIVADINSSVDIRNATISGNTEEGIRVKHMSIAEILGATNVVRNTGGPLTCDATSLVITNLIGKSMKCSNIEGAPGPKP